MPAAAAWRAPPAHGAAIANEAGAALALVNSIAANDSGGTDVANFGTISGAQQPRDGRVRTWPSGIVTLHRRSHARPAPDQRRRDPHARAPGRQPGHRRGQHQPDRHAHPPRPGRRVEGRRQRQRCHRQRQRQHPGRRDLRRRGRWPGVPARRHQWHRGGARHHGTAGAQLHRRRLVQPVPGPGDQQRVLPGEQVRRQLPRLDLADRQQPGARVLGPRVVVEPGQRLRNDPHHAQRLALPGRDLRRQHGRASTSTAPSPSPQACRAATRRAPRRSTSARRAGSRVGSPRG